MTDHEPDWSVERQKIIGLGEQSTRKSYYTELKNNIASLERFKTLINQVSEAIIVVDVSSNLIVDANTTASIILNEPIENILNQALHTILPNIEISQFYEESSLNHHLSIIPKKGQQSIPIEMDFFFSTFNQISYCMIIFRDISQRIKYEEEKRKMEIQMRQSHKMESVGRLAGGIAHDFNNLLTVILGYSDILMHNKEFTELKYVNHINEIRKAADSAKRLTQQLLLFSRNQKLELKPISLSVTINDFSKIISRTIREDIKVIFDIEDIDQIINGDRTQIEQMIMNLCINAQDAIKDDGVITIKVSKINIKPDFCFSVADCTPGDHILVSVGDTGCGIPDSIKANIYDPFFTTKSEGKGTGLGLSTVYGIVKQHKGFITMVSEENLGTMFNIYFPIEQGESSEIKYLSDNMIKKGQGKIIIVEDNELVRNSTKNILEFLGYQVFAPNKFKEIYSLVERIHPDLLLTDVIMPEMNGKQLFDIIKRKNPDLKVLYMSGYTDEIISHHGIIKQSSNFIHKPFTIESLSEKINQLLKNP